MLYKIRDGKAAARDFAEAKPAGEETYLGILRAEEAGVALEKFGYAALSQHPQP